MTPVSPKNEQPQMSRDATLRKSRRGQLNPSTVDERPTLGEFS